jgi:hypothetical protein
MWGQNNLENPTTTLDTSTVVWGQLNLERTTQQRRWGQKKLE